MSEGMQGSGWMAGSLKAEAGCTLSRPGRFAVMSGRSCGGWGCRAKNLHGHHIYVCGMAGLCTHKDSALRGI